MLIERPPLWFRRLFPGACFMIPAQKGNSPRVYLTFDDGPIPEVTPWVLDLLDKYEAKATFFMVGQNVERHPALLEEIKNRGHAIGNHTLHHMKGAGQDTFRYLLDSLRGERITGSKLFRPPHGWIGPSQFRNLRRRYKIIMYDLVTRDYSRFLSAEDVFENVKRYTRNGSIIVFHDSIKSWPRLKEALPLSLSWLKQEGYEFALIPFTETDK